MNKTKKLLLSFLMVFTMILASGSSVAFATETDAKDSNTTESSTKKTDDKAPVYDITVKIVPERGWLVKTSKVNVKVVDNKNTGTFQLKKLEAKIGVNGAWQDITKDGYIEVAENCTVYAQATDSYGTVYSQMRYLDGYDTTPPTFNAAVNNGVLTIEAHDTESGVDCIYINGYKFTPNKKGILKVRLQKFDATYANFSIYVTDNSGNESDPYEIPNPYYKEDTGEDSDEDTANPADSLPDDATANVTGESSGQITSATDENGNDISDEVDGKQFYTVVTKNGQQFYIVIDMTNTEYFEGSTDTAGGGGGTVYFLTNISNNDLLNVTADAENGEVTLPYNSQAAGNAIDDETMSKGEQASEESTEESADKKEEKKESSNDLMLYLIVGVVMVVVLVVVMRRKKSGKSKTEEFEDEEAEDEDEEFELTAENMNQLTEAEDEDEAQEHE